MTTANFSGVRIFKILTVFPKLPIEAMRLMYLITFHEQFSFWAVFEVKKGMIPNAKKYLCFFVYDNNGSSLDTPHC